MITGSGLPASVVNGSQDQLVTAKGDVMLGASNGVRARLPVGTDGYVLTARSGATDGVDWEAGGGGGGLPTIADGHGYEYNGSAVVVDDRAIDLWNTSASPGSVTDWGPTINGISGPIHWGPHDFPFATQIALTAPSVKWEGEGGVVWPATSANAPLSRLIWTPGSGSGVAIKVGADSLLIRDLAIVYAHASGYNDDLVSHQGYTNPPSAFVTYERVYFGTTDSGTSATKTARCLLNLTDAVDPSLLWCSFQGGQSLIRGAESVSDFSNDVDIDHCVFSQWVAQAIANPTTEWRVRSTFEFTDALSVAAFGCDIGTTGSPLISSLLLDDSRFWDGATSGQMAVNQPDTQQLALEVRAGYYDLTGGGAPAFSLLGPGSVKIGGKPDWVAGSKPLVDLGSTSTALKTQVDIDMYVGGNGQAVANSAGHDDVRIRIAIPTSNAEAQHSSVDTILGYKRIGWPQAGNGQSNQPAVALHGSPSGMGWVELTQGTDYAGEILADISGSLTAGEVLIDVTFSTPLYADPGTPYGYSKVLVQLTGQIITGTGIDDEPTSAVAPVVVAQVANTTVGTGITGFSIVSQGASSVTGKVAWAYLVHVI